MSPEAPKYQIGDAIYHRTDEDPGMVLAIVYYGSHCAYKVVWGSRVTEEHHEAELTPERTFTGTSNKKDDDKV